MDYLDPDKKRAHKVRLFVGYALFAVAIGFATLILGYLANGFYVDRSGDFIQNGLVFVDSQPGGADVFLNAEKQQGTTDSRLVIPGGSYTIELQKDGYRDWSRSLTLEGGTLRRLTYARLIPQELETISTLNLRSQPLDASQSIDKRWIVLSHQDRPLSMTLIDTDQALVSATTIDIPLAVVNDPSETGTFAFVDWSNDDTTFLATYTVNGVSEYILINRENPQLSQNITALLNAPGDTVSLLDRRNNEFFVYQNDTKLLFTASLQNGLESEPIVDTPLIAYQTFSDDWLLYIRESGDEGLVDVRFKRGDTDIQLKQLKTDDRYFLELARLGNAPVMAISSQIENRVIVYNDPQNYLNENPDAKIPVATTVLRVPSIKGVTISSDSSVVLGYGESSLASHEFEADRSYSIDLNDSPLDASSKPKWIDGQHLAYSSNGVQYMIDFDGSNNYNLVTSIQKIGSFYANDIADMLSFTPPVAAADTTPALPAQLVVTSLLIEEDR